MPLVPSSSLDRFLFRIAPFLLLSALTVYAQSLGDVARENRESKAQAAPKVITNADLPKSADESREATEPSQAPPRSTAKPTVRNSVSKKPADSRAADQWRRQILLQKRTVGNLEQRLARLQASIPYLDASAHARGEVFNRRQALEQRREAHLQEQLAEQRSRLEDMQDAARRAGMHTVVYDP